MNGATKCEKHRTISLMSHITKLVLRIVINRIRGITLKEVSPEQYGFMPDKGTRNAIFVLKRLVEKQKDVYTCFIDYSKAFDTVKHDSLVELLQSLDIDDADTWLLTNLYWTQTAAVRCDKDLDEHQTRTTTGLCSISTLVRIVHRNDNERNRRHGRNPNWWQCCQ